MPSPRQRRPLASRLVRAAGVGEIAQLSRSRAGRMLVGAVAGILLATLVGLAALWPSDANGRRAAPATVAAIVTKVTDAPCPRAPGAPAQLCRTITVDPSGPLRPGTIQIGPAAGGISFSRGDRVRVSELAALPGLPEGVQQDPYSLSGLDHTRSVLIAAALLGVFALIALRIRGVLALIGVGLSLVLLAAFVVPAILGGSPPVLVALVGSLAVMFVTLTLTNGLGAQTLAGALGVSATLLFTTVVGLIATRLTGLDGSGSELAIQLAQAASGVSLEGVLLAGMVVGSLGVLADTAVTQASAVTALRHASPSLGAGALYRRAVVVGRDHLSATIHTLVLAYAGATLPLLLVLHSGGTSTADTINNTDIAEPILATIVGCAGLIVAVPLTTALAALLVARIPVAVLPEGHGHAH